jgi:glycosyltransferase involved in cell wall biosynthesis
MTVIRRKKILYVITKSNWGGAQRYVYELATGLPLDRYEPIVALGGNGVLAYKLSDTPVRIIHLPSLDRDISPLRDTASFHDLLRIMRAELPDVVHLNSSKVGGLGALAARIAGVPHIIFTAHGWAFNEDRSFFSRMVIRILHFLTILLAHRTIAVSQAVAKEAPAWGLRNKIAMIHQPATPTENILEKDAARKQLAEKIPTLNSEQRLWIGIVAELHKNKGINYAIEAMRDLEIQKKGALMIVGGGQEGNALALQIHENNLEGSVFMLGFEPEASRIMPAFDIFLLPSLTEAFGYVLLEAGFARLPVVASKVGGIPEIIEDSKTGLLVPVRDPDAIAEALKKLIDSPSLRETLASNFKEHVSHGFSREVSLSKTISLYEER